MKIVFVGLGIMGKPMALNLIKGGHELHLYSQSGVPDDLVAAGGVAEASSTAVAAASDVVVLMVPDTPHVEAALFGAGGVAAGLATGGRVIDRRTIPPGADRQSGGLGKRWYV